MDTYSYIWTTEKDKWVLVESKLSGEYSITYITPRSSGGLIIEDDEIYELVIQKMIEEGNRKMTFDEYQTYLLSLVDSEYYSSKPHKDE